MSIALDHNPTFHPSLMSRSLVLVGTTAMWKGPEGRARSTWAFRFNGANNQSTRHASSLHVSNLSVYPRLKARGSRARRPTEVGPAGALWELNGVDLVHRRFAPPEGFA